MGFVGRCGKKQYWRSLFWRMKAGVKKVVKNGGAGKRQLKFQYDPSSYALNFDDGCYSLGGRGNGNPIKDAGFQDCSADSKSTSTTTTIWVYVLWVKS
ncbi:hypothetical protein SLE2022_390870 [Rubroshorea leprosula]